jgi:pimeloyl-ACP methyl ester carboxylesterase
VRWLATALVFALACCSAARQSRLDDATLIGRAGGLQPRLLQARGFNIVGFERAGRAHATLTVYIEGDGRAWLNPWQPSTDPTPTDPIGLRLAAADPASPLLYLARPCQYTTSDPCDRRLWTGARLSPEIVDLFQQLIDDAMRRTDSSRLGLVGYSGGGTLAALLAERRRDVAWLVTIAANLDLAEWVRLESIEPLSGSLDPADSAASIARLPQVHFVGANDRVVPPAVADAFVRHLPTPNGARVIVEPGFDHECCWAAAWPQLLGQLGAER